MKIEHTKTRLRAPKLVSSIMQSVNGGEPQRVVLVELPVEIEVTKAVSKDVAFVHLFPFGEEAINAIAGREEDDRRGLDMVARGGLAEINVLISDQPLLQDEVPRIAFDLKPVRVKGRPKLLIDETGEGWLHMKLRGYFTLDAVARLGAYIDAEAWISTSMSMPLFENREVGGGANAQHDGPPAAPSSKPATTKRGKGKGKKDDGDALGPHDADVDGVRIVVNPKALALAEEAARGGELTVERILSSARASVRLSADSGAKRAVVAPADVEEVIAALGNGAAPTASH